MIRPQPWTEALERHARAARTQPDPETVHQLRVAAGRLSAWLRLARMRVLRDDLGWLRCSAAQLRDLDVLLERRGGEPWSASSARRREELAHELALALATQRCAALLQALEFLPELEEARALERIPHLLERVHACAREALEPDEPVLEELHRLRKRVRRLRYALEWLDREAPATKALQDALGDLRDTALALRTASASGAGAEPLAALQLELDDTQARVRRRWLDFERAGEGA
jgi:CHAD domain-containing protein